MIDFFTYILKSNYRNSSLSQVLKLCINQIFSRFQLVFSSKISHSFLRNFEKKNHQHIYTRRYFLDSGEMLRSEKKNKTSNFFGIHYSNNTIIYVLLICERMCWSPKIFLYKFRQPLHKSLMEKIYLNDRTMVNFQKQKKEGEW